MKTYSAHTVIERSDKKILLTQRADVPIWVIPGGHVKEGETPTKAAEREIREELGILIANLQKVAAYSNNADTLSKNLYKANLGDKKVDISPNYEVRSYGWFETDKLPTPMTLHERQKILDYLQYRGSVIKKRHVVDKKAELVSLLKTPTEFVKVIYAILINRFTTKSFKI